jgi:hypothetical protein
MRLLLAMVVLIGVMVSSGCQPDSSKAGEPTQLEASPTSTQMTELPAGVITPPGKIELPMSQTPTSDPTPPVTGEVPAGILDAIFKDVAGRTGAALEDITVIQAQAVVWGDGSLGCPQPGMEYTQVLVNGYWVVLEVDGKPYDYRATSRGSFFLCEGGSSPVSPGSSPDS